MPQDVPDPQKEYPDVSLAIDFDTDHGYKKPPAWHLWHLQKLGFNGHADVYMGVFWNNKRRRVGATYPYATIEYALGEGIAAPQANEVVSLTVSGTTMNHTVLEGESLQDIVNGMRVLINQFSGVWADDNYGTSTTLRIQSKAPSWSFPGLAVPDGLARLLGAATEPFAITAAFERRAPVHHRRRGRDRGAGDSHGWRGQDRRGGGGRDSGGVRGGWCAWRRAGRWRRGRGVGHQPDRHGHGGEQREPTLGLYGPAWIN